jgi:hypothetical protein
LIQYDFTVPALDAAFTATVLRWMILGLIIGGALWGLRGAVGWFSATREEAL